MSVLCKQSWNHKIVWQPELLAGRCIDSSLLTNTMRSVRTRWVGWLSDSFRILVDFRAGLPIARLDVDRIGPCPVQGLIQVFRLDVRLNS